ncbi:hypothetical protein M3J09_013696 [Ascochyta lentis]
MRTGQSASSCFRTWSRSLILGQQVLTNAAWYLWRQGRYGNAQQIAEKALAARENVLGLNNGQTLNSVMALAGVLQSQGKYKEAEKLHQEALKLKEGRYPKTLP